MGAQHAYAVRSSIRKRLLVMLGIMGVMVLATGLYGLVGVAESNRRTAESVAAARLLVHAVDQARLAQVNFKKQVQEWKNILLRGQERELYDKHLAAFESQERLVRDDLQDLKGVMGRMRLPAGAVDGLAATHAELGRKYREALKGYDRAKPVSGAAVDRAVRGIDRDATDRIDALVEEIQRQTKMGIDEREQQSAVKNERDRKFSQGLLVMIVLALGAGLVISRTIVRDIEREE